MSDFKIPKVYLDIINQVFELEKKAAALQEPHSLQRNINKLKDILEHDMLSLAGKDDAGLVYHNPLGEPYDITRTDCDASIAGDTTGNLYITEVIKPIVRYKQGPLHLIVQKGIVVATTQP